MTYFNYNNPNPYAQNFMPTPVGGYAAATPAPVINVQNANLTIVRTA